MLGAHSVLHGTPIGWHGTFCGLPPIERAIGCGIVDTVAGDLSTRRALLLLPCTGQLDGRSWIGLLNASVEVEVVEEMELELESASHRWETSEPSSLAMYCVISRLPPSSSSSSPLPSPPPFVLLSPFLREWRGSLFVTADFVCWLSSTNIQASSACLPSLSQLW